MLKFLCTAAVDEQHWRAVPDLAGSETPEYLGRAVVALAADPDTTLKEHSGQVGWGGVAPDSCSANHLFALGLGLPQVHLRLDLQPQLLWSSEIER
jgi:hypothetical protein